MELVFFLAGGAMMLAGIIFGVVIATPKGTTKTKENKESGS